jgi:hypothetical protein
VADGILAQVEHAFASKPSDAVPTWIEVDASKCVRFRMKEPRSEVALQVALAGADGCEAVRAGRSWVYEKALAGLGVDGGHAVLRPRPSGVEDLIVVGKGATESAVHYDIVLQDAAWGLRLVDDTLEVLDPAGAPRLRMNRPVLVDAAGRRVRPSVHVGNCEVDRDPSPPWRRPHPRANGPCRVTIDWSKQAMNLLLPAVLDPVWSSTKEMSEARVHATATPLGMSDPQQVLVAGGWSDEASCALASAELYDVPTGTFAAAAPMWEARVKHTATLLYSVSDGHEVLVVGGFGGEPGVAPELASVDRYMVWSASWASDWSHPDMVVARGGHAAVRIPDPNGGAFAVDRVAVFGHSHGPTSEPLLEIMYTDWSSLVWTSASSAPRFRSGAELALVGPTQVLVVGGTDATGAPLASADVYDWQQDAWGSEIPLQHARFGHTLTMVDSSRAMVVGGCAEPCAAELYAAGAFQPVASPPLHLVNHAAVMLDNGKLLVAGGVDLATSEATNLSMLFDVNAGAWTATENSLAEARVHHTAAGLSDGRALLAGGASTTSASGGLHSAEIYGLLRLGEPCKLNERCLSGYCSRDGVCCESACGRCEACTQALTGEPDGTCVSIPNGADPFDDCGQGTWCSELVTCDGLGDCKREDLTCPGFECDYGAECITGFCSEGYCCDKPCKGACENCGGPTEGVCRLHEGPRAPSKGKPGCGLDACRGTCDGISPECTYPEGPVGDAPPPMGCAGFICKGSTAYAASCSSGECLETAPTDCGLFGCDPVIGCHSSCTSYLQCATGARCDTKTGTCIAPPNEPDSEDDSCSCSQPGRQPLPPSLGWLLPAAAALLLSRRRGATFNDASDRSATA